MHRAKRTGVYRSRYESEIAGHNPFLEYETRKLRYFVPAQRKTYTPDWTIRAEYSATGREILVESKGVLSPADRKKTLFVLENNPELDLRFLFQDPNLHIVLGNPKSQTYAQWAESLGLTWAGGRKIPSEWLTRIQ